MAEKKYFDINAQQTFYDKLKTIFQSISNLVTSWSSTPSDTKYPSEKLVKDELDTKVNTSDAVDVIAGDNVDIQQTENGVKISALKNLVTDWQSAPDDTHYPSVKLVKDALDTKVDTSEIVNISLDASYLESNRRLVFNDIVFDNIYPILGKYGLATFPEDTTVTATVFSGDKEWLLDWRPYLIDMTAVAGETAKKPVAELMKNNWLRKIDGTYAPVCGITSTQAAALNGKKDTLYWKTGSAGDKVSATISTAFDSSGNFVPSAFWEYVKANLSDVNTAAGVTYAAPIEVKVYVGSQAYEFGSYTEYHIPAPWETTETKYSVFIGRDTDVYVVDGYSETTGEHMRGLTAKPVPVGSKEFDPEFFKLRRTGISPGPSTTVGNKTRNFFYNYNGTDSNTKGNAGSLSILVNNGTYPRTCDASQYTTAKWARSNNSGGNSGNAVPVGEGGYHSLNAFLCSVEAAYQTRNICAPTAFSTGNSSNDACNSAATYRTNGGFMLTYNGSTTYHQISADLKSRLGTSSSVYVYSIINNQYAHFQCMEPQIAASLAAEMGIAVNTDFKWNGGTWHYETPSAFTVTDLSNGRMNCRIYKDIAFTNKTISSVSGCSGSVNLRASLIEGMNTVGDIWWFQGGGAELIYMTDGTGATNYKYSFYLEPDQAKWIATSTDEKHTNGSLFTCENAYRCLIEDSTIGTLGNTYCLSRTGYTPVRRSNGGAAYTGECCYQYRQIDDDAKGSSGIRSRRSLRFRGTAHTSLCSPRYLSAHRPSYALALFGCSAQVLLQ